ncbi:hypothetical protein B0A52_04554 [Exophiala mesophila]|uniref:Uncharacterized protein n=1 Tax=Exophiala mesophila TaxID=212818 RepID=A0A438N9Q0_EXOME|nr:hypothetical protein B0A52_04554 [Exophiala mesophila]
MLLSSRSSPPKPLKITGSETTSYLSVKHLIPRTPIPSPSLPSILPRHGKKPPKLNSRKIVRALLWLSFLILAWYIVAFGRRQSRRLSELTFLTSLGKTYEIVEAPELPDHATPISLTDHRGRSYWTISIPEKLTFPLPHADYADVCSQVEDVARHVAGSNWRDRDHEDYYHSEPDYIDVDQAQDQHFLPHSASSLASLDHRPICEKSLTYVLDAADAGLGATLMGLFLSYSLAEHEDRTFFIDDAHFPYGDFSTFFTSKPSPDCRPPPASHRVPCPHQAKHLVISAATTSWVFGESFHQHFSKRDIFDMARHGYEALFHITQPDASYIEERLSKLRNQSRSLEQQHDAPLLETAETGLVGVHIRRGDRHPFTYAYSYGYIPLEVYVQTATKLIGQSSQWMLVLASDDPEMYERVAERGDGLPNIVKAQAKISLASKRKLDSGLGWEGGFFKDLFWGLGLPDHVARVLAERMGSPKPIKVRPSHGGEVDYYVEDKERNDYGGEDGVFPRRRESGVLGDGTARDDDDGDAHASVRENTDLDLDLDFDRDHRTHPSKEALELRQFLARAYLLDLAVLANTDKVVCAVSSHTCRLLAVMLGWERAFDRGDWNNVDGNYDWQAVDF